MNLLGKAVAALKKNDLDTALDSLIKVWRETHSTALAETIDQLSSLAAEQRGPLPGRTKKVPATAWDALVKKGNPGDFTLLFGSLTSVCTSKKDYRTRLEALKKLGVDPRLSNALMEWIASPPRALALSLSRPFWYAGFHAIHLIKDPRVAHRREAARRAR